MIVDWTAEYAMSIGLGLERENDRRNRKITILCCVRRIPFSRSLQLQLIGRSNDEGVFLWRADGRSSGSTDIKFGDKDRNTIYPDLTTDIQPSWLPAYAVPDIAIHSSSSADHRRGRTGSARGEGKGVAHVW